MKIKGKDNFDRDNVSDWLVCENVNEYMGALIVKFLNDREGVNGSWYYMLVADDDKLHTWEP